ncbi:carboxylesterase family protein [Corynebacterium sp. 32222D000AT]|uniref:carboxylesterase family protein n=1 Tax=unclassified Corynebacterium TaxID=2624378 RepID=UPI002AA01D31|nr:carboxylesterase family protein [Mycobacteriaceae bacterium]MDY5830112.1 carboxylesterase family protein [Corynebacterium sp.]
MAPESLELPAAAPADPFDAAPQVGALTITRPTSTRPGADLPVVVFIHGGGFDSGSHRETIGDAPARAGLILVQLSYRLGLAGFARFERDEPRSYRGINDCLAGLEWVQKNIEAYGGDPTNVTLVGQSAGAAIALWLCRRDHFRGGFRRAVALSPAFPRAPFSRRKASLRTALSAPVTRRSLSKLAQSGRLERGYRRFRARHALDIALGPWPLEPAELAAVPLVISSTREEMWDQPGARRLDRFHIPPRPLAAALSLPRFATWRAGTHSVTNRAVVGDAAIRRWVAAVAHQHPHPELVRHIEFVRSDGAPARHCDDLPALFDPADGVFADWLARFARTGDAGFPAGTARRFDLATGAHAEHPGPLDYLWACYRPDTPNR